MEDKDNLGKPLPENNGKDSGSHKESGEERQKRRLSHQKSEFSLPGCKIEVNTLNISNCSINIYSGDSNPSAQEIDEMCEAYFDYLCNGDEQKEQALITLKQFIRKKTVLKEFLEYLENCTSNQFLSTAIKDDYIKKGLLSKAQVTDGRFIESLIVFAPNIIKGANPRSVRAALIKSFD